MFPQPDVEFSLFLFTQDRQNLSTIAQFLSGHNYLKYHLWNTDRAPNDRCRRCDEAVETAWHLLTDCPSLATYRRACLSLIHI